MTNEQKENLMNLMQAGFEYAADRRIQLRVYEGYPHMEDEIKRADDDMKRFLEELERLKNEN